MNAYRPRVTAGLWLAMMLAIALLGSKLLTKDWLETGFLALLPASEQQPEIAHAVKQHNHQRDRKVIWLTGAATSETAKEDARQLKQQLERSGLFSNILLEMSQKQLSDRYQQLFPFRYQLLDADARALLTRNPKDLLERNLEKLYGPMGQMAVADLERDPLLLFSHYFFAQNSIKLSVEQGMVVIPDDNKAWVLLLTELKDSHLQLDQLENLWALVNTTKVQLKRAGGDLLVTGMPLFTAQGAESAKQEIATVGVGSSAGIVILMLLTFRSIRPLLLSFVAIGSGLFVALIVTILVFGKIHIITLIFGASLIGVADDYALHFFCDSFGERHWQPRLGLRYLFPGLVIGLLTNLACYLGLAFSPFPGLQEVALFSAIGLLVAWLTVVMLFPILLSGFQSKHQPVILKAAHYWQQHWPRWLLANRRWLMPVVVIFILGGLGQLSPRDDVRLLQAASVELMEAADKIKKLLPVSQENQFFLVSGSDSAEWHQNEQRLLAHLNEITKQNKLAAYQGLSAYWPDENRQQANYQLLAKTLYMSGLVKQYMSDLGFNENAIASEYDLFKAAKNQLISLPEWLKLADESKQQLWLGCHNGVCRSKVTLTGITDARSLANLNQLAGVIWVDQVEELSGLFARYRVQGSLLLTAAYVLVFISLICKFGSRNALTIAAIPVVSALVSLAMIGWGGQLFSLFNLFALLLVLGIGVDDAIFFFMADRAGQLSYLDGDEAANKRKSTSLAVTLSAFTTLLAFGLLAVSKTEVVHAFGFTVATGLLTALLCSPLVGYKLNGS